MNVYSYDNTIIVYALLCVKRFYRFIFIYRNGKAVYDKLFKIIKNKTPRDLPAGLNI